MVTIPDEVRERIRAYLAHQAAKEPAEIRSIVQQGHDQLFGALDGLSAEQAIFKPGPDDWSVLEVLGHAVQSERGVARICGLLARGETPAGFGDEGEARPRPGINPATKSFPSLAEARPALEEAHQELLAFIDALSSEADVETRYEHGFFGLLNCREWAVFQRLHDGDHAGQIEKIKSARGYPPS
ncbi:MAG: hypothetical protein A2148_06700 [Chloroflexi bacterium RBG_16_68_14]|nr:MAG: hypothetical protein A2148_06700 [Chloroflexi bacterium RBG_16_68_14]